MSSRVAPMAWPPSFTEIDDTPGVKCLYGGEAHLTSQNAICLGPRSGGRVHSSVQGTSWAAGLELVGDDERPVAHAGLLPLRLLAERTGLRAGLSAAGFRPVI